jgi:hypothetical protein
MSCSKHPTSPGGVATASSTAIINGTPTGSANFRNVGALLMDFDANGVINASDLLCSGSLISQTVFLTAGHCLSFLPPGATLYVTFAADLTAPGFSTITATGFAIDPLYGRGSDPVDLGVVTLPAGSTAGITPLGLPPAGLLDSLSAQGGLRGQDFINVGYGADASRTGPPAFPSTGRREMSISSFKSLDKLYLGLLMAQAATGNGGDCYGDSGSPKFIAGNTSMIVAVVNWGDAPCRALSKNYRLDITSARTFLGRYVAVP